jgi:serine/threonine protein kinase
MHPDKVREPDDRFVELLAAYDAAVASGQLTPLPLDTNSANWHGRLARAQAVVERLERDRVRRGIGEPAREPRNGDAPGLAYDGDGRLVQLHHYQILREIGTGGAGTVYLAFDTKLDRQVALKIPRLEVIAAPSLRHRFLREARTAAGFDHPNIVAVFETGEIGPLCYMVSAYCRGISLREWYVRRDDPVAPRHAAAFMSTIAGAVGYFHERGVIHRDLKPANILLERLELPNGAGALTNGTETEVSAYDLDLADFIPKVSDFGLAKNLDLDEGQTRSGTILGTPRYMAPEQAEGRVRMVGPHSDVFALGVILHELLTRQSPTWEAAEHGPTLVPPRKFQPNIPRELDAVCRRCLARESERRYRNASELAAALQAFVSSDLNDSWITGLWRRAVKTVLPPRHA